MFWHCTAVAMDLLWSYKSHCDGDLPVQRFSQAVQLSLLNSVRICHGTAFVHRRTDGAKRAGWLLAYLFVAVVCYMYMMTSFIIANGNNRRG